MKRQNIFTGTKYEKENGYSRAVKIRNSIYFAGTTAINENGEIVSKNSAYAQTMFILKKIESVLHKLNSKKEEVVRTRIYTIDMDRQKEIGKAHKEFFGKVYPCLTLVGVKSLAHSDMLVEIEIEAITNK